ncbi:MAG: pyridoxamine kinase [Clostridia bacterium]|nr:pyridoxamine kinase [Clostridia bacterium]
MRVLAINDLSCVGKCSLTVTLPVLSACGITCDVLPTAVLSTHTGGFENYTFRDLTKDVPAILKQWKELGLTFDYICSGYLGSIEQIDLVSEIKRDFLKENGKFIVDPVMGDGGKLYKGFTNAFVEKMRSLCRQADFILPNVTEACYLTDLPYTENANGALLLNELKKLCPRPIVTGIMKENSVSVFFTDENGKEREYVHENVEGFFHGAGDVFTSAFVACLANGAEEEKAISLSSEFTAASIRRSAKEVPDKRYGLNFEKEIFSFLQKLLSNG